MPKILQFLIQNILKTHKEIQNALLKKGQATVEYILLLVVLVFIVTGLREVFFKPFNEAFMGGYKNYYVCFFEKATLPGIDNTGCRPPTWTPGHWPAGGSPGGGNTSGSPGGGNTSGSPGGGNTSGSPGGGNTSGSPGGGSTGGSPGGGNTTGNPWGEYPGGGTGASGVSETPKDSFPISGEQDKNKTFNSSNNNQFLAQSSSDTLEDDFDKKRNKKQNRTRFKVKRKKRDASTLTSASGNRSNQSSSEGDRFLMSGDSYEFEENEQEERQAAIAVSTNKSNQKTDSEKKASFAVNKKNQQKTQVEDDESITFGKFIKYIIIALLILGMLWFIGSQLMQVSENLKAS